MGKYFLNHHRIFYAGDDPDVTHGALIRVRVAASTGGVVFRAGEGVGMVTMPGLPKVPAAESIDIDDQGQIVGLF